MRSQTFLPFGVAILAAMTMIRAASAAGDAAAGARAFQNCAGCHSLEAGQHFTGPSLAAIWGRVAGTIPGFLRYSPALKAAKIVWNEETLDRWLANPAGFIPKNFMPFAGIANAQARADLIAFLEGLSKGTVVPPPAQQGGMMGMGAPDLQDLKAVGPDQQVVAVRYCGDSYFVKTAAGETLPFWEYNLRLHTDSTEKGPPRGRPALVPAGMLGDRALLVFASPSEISAFVRAQCEPGELP